MKGSLMESFNRKFDNKLNESFKIVSDLSDYEPWGGAVSTWNKIIESDKLDEFEDLMEMEYPDGLSVTSLNDALWFDGEQILSDLGLSDYPKTITVRVFNIKYDDEEIDVEDTETYPDHIDELEVEIESEDDDVDDKVRDAIYSELPVRYFDIEDFDYEEIKDKVEEGCEKKNESSTIDKIDADADDKKEKLKAFMKKKIDDIDADRDDKKEKIGECSLKEDDNWSDDLLGTGYGFYYNKKLVYTANNERERDAFINKYKGKYNFRKIDDNTYIVTAGTTPNYRPLYASKKTNTDGEKLNEQDKPAAISIEDAQKWVDYDMKKYGKISGRTNRLVRKAGFQIVKDTYGDYEVIAGKYDESVGKEKYYFVEDDSWGQHGAFIETLYLTKEEADKVKKTRTHNGKRGFFTKDYEEALYYTQD